MDLERSEFFSGECELKKIRTAYSVVRVCRQVNIWGRQAIRIWTPLAGSLEKMKNQTERPLEGDMKPEKAED